MLKWNKNGKEYVVMEYQDKWVLKKVDGRLVVKFELSKLDYPTIEELEAYFNGCDTF